MHVHCQQRILPRQQRLLVLFQLPRRVKLIILQTCVRVFEENRKLQQFACCMCLTIFCTKLEVIALIVLDFVTTEKMLENSFCLQTCLQVIVLTSKT